MLLGRLAKNGSGEISEWQDSFVRSKSLKDPANHDDDDDGDDDVGVLVV